MLIYGRRPVLDAAREGRARRILLARGVEKRLVREVEETGVPYQWTSRVELARLVGTTRHQGIAAFVEDLDYADPEAPFRRAESLGEQPLLVLLDGVTDPQNYGAIIRSAEALGAHGVVSEERRSAPLSAATLKASAGAAARIPLVRVKNLPRYIEELKARGVWVYGLAGEGERTLEEADYRRPLALVVGSEGRGMRRLVRERCDELIRIPLRGSTPALNASVAAGIALYRAWQGREASGGPAGPAD